jgi:hypothetical protein
MNNTLKALKTTGDELRVGNYLALFGGKDLVGDFFTEKTVFNSNYTEIGLLYVDFEHGRDPDKAGNDANNVLGVVDWKSARIDDKGLFVERVLNRRKQYVKFLEELIEAGAVGTSSQAVSGKVQRKSTGEIVEWPLMRDSLTVMPMEPRMIAENVLTAAKSLAEIFPCSKSLALFTGNPIEDEEIKTIEMLKTIRDIEAYSISELGMPKSKAVAFASKLSQIFKAGPGDPESLKGGPGDPEAKALLDLLLRSRTMTVRL